MTTPMNSSPKRPDPERLEQTVRAETTAKLAAIGPLADAYTRLLHARDAFAEHDAANVAAVSQARSNAIRAGFDEKTLAQLGFTAATEVLKSPNSRRAAPPKHPPTPARPSAARAVTPSPPPANPTTVESDESPGRNDNKQ